MKIYILISVFFIAFISCKNKTQEENIKKIDSLYSVSNDLINKIDSIDLKTISSYYEAIKQNNLVFKEQLTAFPKDLSIKNKLTQYGYTEKVFKKTPKKLAICYTDIEMSLLQLDALRKDVEHELLIDEDFAKYFNDEKKILDNLNSEVNTLIDVLDKNSELYIELMPDIQAFVDSLIGI
jgi:hypothetical protein